MPAPKASLMLPALLFALLLTSGCVKGTSNRVSLLSPGVRGGTQAPRSPGRGWLALCQTASNRWTLVPANVKARRVRDEQVDQAGEQTGCEIRSSQPGAFCLFRHRTLRPGSVTAAEFSTVKPSGLNLLNRMGFGVPVLLSIDKYLLKAADAEAPPSHYTLSVSVNDGPPLTLGSFERGIEPAFEGVFLIWAGDLNRDGVADFLFEHQSFNRKGQSLYLSQNAGGGYQKAGMDVWTDHE
jgi:hypothetical protein